MAASKTDYIIPAILGIVLILIFFNVFKKKEPEDNVNANNPEAQYNIPANNQSPSAVSTGKMPSYKVAHVTKNNRNGLVVTVRLNEKITEEQIASIAREVKTQMNATVANATVFFILPGDVVGAGAWAKASFEPELKVEMVFGLSKETQDAISSSNELKGFVGVWDYTHDAVMIIRKVSDERYEFAYADPRNISQPSESPFPLQKIKRNGQTIYKELESSFYYIIKKNGDLAIYNEDGLESTMKRIK